MGALVCSILLLAVVACEPPGSPSGNGNEAQRTSSATASAGAGNQGGDETGNQGGDETGNRGGNEEPGAVAAPGPPVLPPGPAAPGNPPANDDAAVLDWLPPGPVSRTDPPWYPALAAAQCPALPVPGDQEASVWDAAALLCPALTGDAAAWDRAIPVLAAMKPPTDCLELGAYQALQRAVAFHRQRPDITPELRTATGTACQPTLEAVEATVDGSGTATVCGGESFYLVGRLGGLPASAVRAVSVGAVSVPVTKDDGGFSFAAPPVPTDGAVTVRISNADVQVDGAATLTYVQPVQPCTQASETSTPTESAPQQEPSPSESASEDTGTGTETEAGDEGGGAAG
jgi:hypothetical protein